jgi:hypothetical protein
LAGFEVTLYGRIWVTPEERNSESIRDSGDAHHGHPRLFGTFEVAEIGPVHTYAFARSCLAPATLLSQIPNPLAEAP